jgi:hypothetical protein
MRNTLALMTLLALSAPLPARAQSSEATALITRWLAAQNGGDFAAYQALYAARFTGVRRSGNRTVMLDRAGWLKDRGRMFKKPMKVSVDKVTGSGGEGSELVRFVQTWASGSYQDVGPKELLLIRDGGTVRIAREEMLTSQLGTSAPVAAGGLERLAFVLDGELVLAKAPEEAWASGPARLDDDGSSGQWSASRSVDPKKLPPALAAWSGKKVHLFGGAKPCDATVGTMRIVSRERPHFGTVQEWRERKLSKRRLADLVWGAEAGRVLAAQLVGGCSALYARAAGVPTGDVVTAGTADAALRMRALAEFRRLPAAQAAQKDYGTRDDSEGQAWDEDAVVKIVRTQSHGQPLTLVQVRAEAGDECGGHLELSVLFEVGAGGKLVLRSAADATLPELTGAADVDGDGEPELLFGLGYLRRKGAVYEPAAELRIPDYDCPC